MLRIYNAPLCVLSNFSVPSGFEGIKEQEICNKIMTKMLENYNTLFELEGLKKDEEKPVCEELARIILVKVSISNILLCYNKSIMQAYCRLQFRNHLVKWEAGTVIIMFSVLDLYTVYKSTDRLIFITHWKVDSIKHLHSLLVTHSFLVYIGIRKKNIFKNI